MNYGLGSHYCELIVKYFPLLNIKLYEFQMFKVSISNAIVFIGKLNSE